MVTALKKRPLDVTGMFVPTRLPSERLSCALSLQHRNLPLRMSPSPPAPCPKGSCARSASPGSPRATVGTPAGGLRPVPIAVRRVLFPTLTQRTLTPPGR